MNTLTINRALKHLLKKIFQVNFRRAAAAGDLGTVQRLIDEESVDINCAGRNGATALHKV